MKYPNPRIERLKQLLGLEERRAGLQQELESLTQEMHSLRDSLFEERGHTSGVASVISKTSSPASAKPAASAPETAAPRGGRRKRMKRGALKDQIMSALETAGEAGVRVTELAQALAIKPVNIHSWFHSAVRRHPNIKKLQGGHYRLSGASASQSGKVNGASSAPAGKASPAVKTSRRSAGAEAAKPANSADQTGKESSGGTRRGELTSRILSEMKSAGAKGINVRELADKVGAPHKNIYVWFATTGKKNPKVKKLGPAHYKLS